MMIPTTTGPSRSWTVLLVAGALTLCGGCGDDEGLSGDGTDGTGSTTGTTGELTADPSTGTTAPTTGTTAPTSESTDETSDPTSTTGTGDSTTTGGDESPLDQAVEAIGGADALADLELLRITADGSRRVDYEAPTPDGLMDVSAYTASYLFDVPSENFRLDTERTPLFEALQFGPPQPYSIVLNGALGGLSARAGFSPPGNFPSQHVGALVTQQRLFNPHFYLREALADGSLAVDGGSEDYEGSPHSIISFDGAVGEIRLFVHPDTGFISKLETTENHPLARDTPLEVRYISWQSRGELAFPETVELYAGGALVQEETRTDIEIEPTFPADTFDLPPEVDNPTLDASAFAFGQQTHQALEGFFNLAFYVNEEPMLGSSQLVPGVTLIAGAPVNSVVVSYDQGLVLLEAPVTPAHGTNIVEALGLTFPGLDITHVVQSHHHQDHASGVRSLVAAGATAVVGDGVGDFWDGILSAESTVRPDALDSSAVVPVVEVVPEDGVFVIEDANVTITVYHVSANPHADDMVFTAVDIGGETLVYVADLYNAGFGGTLVLGGPAAFFAALRDTGILDAACVSALPLTIVPSHGVPQSLAASLSELAGLGVDVGCP